MRAAVLCLLAVVLCAAAADAAAAASEAKPNASACAVPDALRESGETAEARARYVKLLDATPSLSCAQDGLAAINDDSGVAATIDDIVDAVPYALVVAGLITAVTLLLLQIPAHWPGGRRRVERMTIIGRPIRAVFRPKLAFAKFDDSACDQTAIGGPIAARVKERLERFREQREREDPMNYDLDHGTGNEEFADLISGDASLREAIDKASEISDQTKIVSAIIDLLYRVLPKRRLTVGGTIEPVADCRVAATLTLEDGPRMAAAVTLRGPKVVGSPGPGDYLAMADPAAVWVQYEVARAINHDGITSDDSETYTLIREGLEFESRGDGERARAAYARALELNDRSWGARLNQALAEIRFANEYDRAIAMLLVALGEMRKPVSA